MPGTNAGTGQPISFQCAACRRTTGPCRIWRNNDYTRCSHTQRRTGQTRPHRGPQGGKRMLREHHQYECECGHTGWSRVRGVELLPLVETPHD